MVPPHTHIFAGKLIEMHTSAYTPIDTGAYKWARKLNTHAAIRARTKP